MPSIRGSLENFLPLVDAWVVAPEDNQHGKAYRALIDTGATRTAVSERLVEAHQLPYRGKMLIQTARSAPERRRAYGFKIGLYCYSDEPHSQNHTLFVFEREFAAPPFQSNNCFDLIIGNDFLSTGRFVLDRLEFTFDFRPTF
jgi:hypothetical protein